MPDRMTVAAPVSAVFAMSWTGRRFVSVKYPVSSWIGAASTMPMITAQIANSRGLLPGVLRDALASRRRAW